MSNLTKGEKQLIDLGYKKVKEPDMEEIVFYKPTEGIRFVFENKTVELEKWATVLRVKELQAINQIIKDYGWE